MEFVVRSKELSLGRYDTDKIANGYLDRYDSFLYPLVSRDVKVLEIGVRAGGSLLLWRDYFPKGVIVGVDVALPDGLSGEDRIQIFRGSQEDTAFLSEVALKTAPEGFDLIIDDASHIGELTKVAFWHLFDNHLKPSGLYVIEDWGTGYWDDWPDGRSFQPEPPWRSLGLRLLRKLTLVREAPWANHNYGMVGFVKELVDEQGAADLTQARMSGVPARTSRFEKMVITPSIVFITKSAR
ncbi:MAG: class I SAM-dependent methyltransferase [Lysobacterales bacterium]|nr:MAG: class I SAM-dependent methyltransferase [Xanthomonadales bacterium]